MSGEHTWRGAHAAVRWSGIAMLCGVGLLAGCFADSTDRSGGSNGSGASYAMSSGGGATTQPPLVHVVDVDTGGTLVTTPGNGIGVYVEYQSGGHWSLSWTCDTALTNLSCSFIVDASVATGTLAAPSNTPPPGDAVSQPSDTQIEAVTTTTTSVDGILFDTTAGVPVTVTVALNAPVSFFFVQDNQVNGGYQGVLANPLIFQPSTP
jgi:hypothetical protein